jgi:hypothetical protein
MYTVGVGWVLHARRSCYPRELYKDPRPVTYCLQLPQLLCNEVETLFAAAETCNKVQRRLYRPTVPSPSPIATLVLTLSCYFIPALVNLSICNFAVTQTTDLYIRAVHSRCVHKQPQVRGRFNK